MAVRACHRQARTPTIESVSSHLLQKSSNRFRYGPPKKGRLGDLEKGGRDQHGKNPLFSSSIYRRDCLQFFLVQEQFKFFSQ